MLQGSPTVGPGESWAVGSWERYQQNFQIRTQYRGSDQLPTCPRPYSPTPNSHTLSLSRVCARSLSP